MLSSLLEGARQLGGEVGDDRDCRSRAEKETRGDAGGDKEQSQTEGGISDLAFDSPLHL